MRPKASSWPVIAVVGLLVAAAMIVMPFDVQAAVTIRTERLPSDLSRLLDLSELWGHGLGALLVSITVWLLMPQQRPGLYRLVAGCILAGLLTNLIKLFAWRWRPGFFWYQDNLLSTWVATEMIPISNLNTEHDSQSFPSGHSASAVALAYGMTMLAPRGAPVYWTLACCACVQRVSFNAHWPSDVLVGAAIGLGMSALVFALPVAGRNSAKLLTPSACAALPSQSHHPTAN